MSSQIPAKTSLRVVNRPGSYCSRILKASVYVTGSCQLVIESSVSELVKRVSLKESGLFFYMEAFMKVLDKVLGV